MKLYSNFRIYTLNQRMIWFPSPYVIKPIPPNSYLSFHFTETMKRICVLLSNIRKGCRYRRRNKIGCNNEKSIKDGEKELISTSILFNLIALNNSGQTKPNWSIIQKRIRRYPQDAMYKDPVSRRTPFLILLQLVLQHSYCKHSLATLKVILEAHPAALYEQDIDGRNALHYLAQYSNSGSSKIFDLLLIKERCWNKDESEIQLLFAKIMEHIPDSLISDHILSFINNPALTKDCFGNTPLHLLCMNPSSSISMIQNVLALNFNAASATNGLGRTPLHCLCLFNANARTTRPILDAAPENVLLVDSSGNLPLHYAAGIPEFQGICIEKKNSFARYFLDTIKLLLDIYPDAAISKNKEGKVPLHYACYASQSLEVVRALLHIASSSILEEDIDGRTPVYYAARPHRKRNQRINYQIQAYCSLAHGDAIGT